jgi:hypothetical protein
MTSPIALNTRTHCRVWGVGVTNNCGFQIWWSELLDASVTITVHTLNFFFTTNLLLYFFWFSNWSLVPSLLLLSATHGFSFTTEISWSELSSQRKPNCLNSWIFKRWILKSSSQLLAPVLSIVYRCTPILLTPPLFLKMVSLYRPGADTNHRKHVTWSLLNQPLALCLLPSKGLGMDLQKTRRVIATVRCVTSLRMHKLRGHRKQS